MSQQLSEPVEEDHTGRTRLHVGGRLLRHLPFQFLGVRQVEGGDHRRQASDVQRTTGVHAFTGEERVLDSADGEGLCQVPV